MPRKPQRLQRFLFRLFFLSLAGWALNALRREPRNDEDVESLRAGDFKAPTPKGRVELERWEDGRPSAVRRRAVLAMVFSTLFFAGAAFTAGAGDQAARLLEEEMTTLAEEASVPADEAAPAEPAAPEAAAPESEQSEPAPAPAPETAPAPAAAPEAAPEEADPVAADTAAPAADSASDEAQPVRSGSARAARTALRKAPSAKAARTARQQHRQAKQRRPVERPQASAEEEAAAHGGAAVIWLNSALPDPTPRAKRLQRSFLKGLVRTSRAAKVDWALVLGVLRAEGHRGRVPAKPAEVRSLARKLRAAGARRDEWAAALAVVGSTDLADNAVALARYNRAVGTEALVRGLANRHEALAKRVLKDGRIDLYAGGRDDLTFGRIDVRVVALMRYLAESFGQVTVTSLFSGHRMFARPGVVSAHVYGHAVDVAGLAGRSITGNQEPGGLTEQAVRSILLLPAELQPRQVISLLGLGGVSFPLADHHDHIHVGY